MCLMCSFFYQHFVTRNVLYKNIYENMLTRKALQDLQLWMSGSFCQNETSSLTSVTSYSSRLLHMEVGNGKERKEMLIREQKSVISDSLTAGSEHSLCVCVWNCRFTRWTAAHDDRGTWSLAVNTEGRTKGRGGRYRGMAGLGGRREQTEYLTWRKRWRRKETEEWISDLNLPVSKVRGTEC